MGKHIELIQGSDEWKIFRLGKVSASRVSDVMSRTKSGYSASRTNYMMQLLCERLTGKAEDSFVSAAMLRGTEKEPMARAAYEAENGCLVQEVGCFVHDDIDSLIASPDGLVMTDGLIEIKNPNTSTHIDFLRTGKPDGKYQLQMLAQMACTGRKWCDFVSFDDRLPAQLQYSKVRFERDDIRINEMLVEIEKFLHELNELESEMLSRMAA